MSGARRRRPTPAPPTGMTLQTKVGLLGLSVAVLIGGAVLERRFGAEHGRRRDGARGVDLLLEPLSPAELPRIPGLPATRGARRVRTVKVREGDTLGKIAGRTLGTTRGWKAILRVNRDQIQSPAQLRVGMVLRLPGPRWREWMDGRRGRRSAGRASSTQAPHAADRSSSPAGGLSLDGRTYIVQRGDNLGTIAQKALGSARHADRIFEANRRTLPSPDRLKIGMVLRIPRRALSR